jgi:hypothetical protein
MYRRSTILLLSREAKIVYLHRSIMPEMDPAKVVGTCFYDHHTDPEMKRLSREAFERSRDGEVVERLTKLFGEWMRVRTRPVKEHGCHTLEAAVVLTAVTVDPVFLELTDEQHATLELVSQGESPEEIANSLGVSPATVRSTLHRCRKKIGLSSYSFSLWIDWHYGADRILTGDSLATPDSISADIRGAEDNSSS